MADVTSKILLEDMNERIEKLEIEKHALQTVVISLLAAMPSEQAAAAKRHLFDLVSSLSIGASSEMADRLERQRATFENIFLAVK
ncbi:hypothetical protein [Enterobacter hormaechei]|uniref:hypothetical protein n=1 Tax=Enterobacter hormaechei TaxID=158836 RepID=UPI00254E7C9C|nr:hypothetical protein [Enterobacter hormaechei]MDK9957317.1 hypothetical protein [Enterobacter hormaechei]